MRNQLLAVLSLSAAFLASLTLPVSAGRIDLPVGTLTVVQNPLNQSETRILVQFDLPPELLGARIEAAYLDVQLSVGELDVARAKVEVHSMDRSWTPSDVTWADVAKEQKVAGFAGPSSLVEPGTAGPARFEATKLVQSWADAPAKNYGVVISVQSEHISPTLGAPSASRGAPGPLLRIWYSR